MTIEAMKMRHPIKAVGTGLVDQIPVATGDQVAGGDVLVAFAIQVLAMESSVPSVIDQQDNQSD